MSSLLRKYTADLLTNIGATIIIAVALGIGGAVMVYMGAAWTKPLIVGGFIALITFLILLAIKAIRLLPPKVEPTTPENVQGRVRDWLDTFSLTATKSKPTDTHFRLDVAVNGRNIGVVHPIVGSEYLHFFANIVPDEDDKRILGALSESEKATTTVALKLELARARMGYLRFSLDGFTIFKQIPIKPELNEASFIERIWEMEAMLNALFMVVASQNIKHQEVVDLIGSRRNSELPEYVKGPEAFQKFEDAMKKLSYLASRPVQTEEETSKD